MTFSVWAPFATRVAVLDELGEAELHPCERGWWITDREPAGRYTIDVDGSRIPDPRSPHQPDGVDGPSALVDHEAFAWSDAQWRNAPWGTQIIYELHVGTFSEAGTFDGAIEHLDHLVRLGVDTVELMPVNTFPGDRGWGYDGVLLSAPQASYGGPEGLKRLVDACHARGLAVIVDVVYNHLGPSGNHLPRLGPYFTDAHSTPWGPAVNLEEAGCDEVRRFFVDNALTWVRDYHVDGLRVDAVHAFVDRTARPFLEELCHEVQQQGRLLGRPVWMIAESDLNDPKVVRPPGRGGYGFDATWSDDLHHALHALVTGERTGYYEDFGTLEHLAGALAHGYVYRGGYSPHRGRAHGRAADDVDPSRFLAYTQTHDQVGNRARGERLGMLTPVARVEIAAAFVLLGPFTPMLFQGEEWAASTPFLYFTDHADPDLGEAVRNGRRAEFAAFGWAPEDVPDPQDVATFAASRLRWDELADPAHDRVHTWYRELIAERRRAQRLGTLARQGVHVDGSTRCLTLDMGAYVVVANLGETDALVALPAGATDLARSNDHRASVVGHCVALGPDGLAVVRRP